LGGFESLQKLKPNGMEEMARQGKSFTDQEVRRIISLLTTTDMTIGEIANRMNCTRSAIAAVNRKFRLRDYAGLRSSWRVLQEPDAA
jgi:hypothetical protein